MIYIRKTEEPGWLAEFRKNHPGSVYKSEEFETYRSSLRALLLKEQKFLCAYCCARIDEKHAHNEHIEPQNPTRSASSKRTFAINR